MKKLFVPIFVLALLAIIAAAVLVYSYKFNSDGVNQARVVINDSKFLVEIADTPAEQTRGLSGRQNLAENQGMLFIFSQPGNYGFWMKDMKFAIDIVWIRGKKIIGFKKNAAPESYPAVFYPPSGADAVLEVSAGTADKFNFKAGDAVKML